MIQFFSVLKNLLKILPEDNSDPSKWQDLSNEELSKISNDFGNNFLQQFMQNMISKRVPIHQAITVLEAMFNSILITHYKHFAKNKQAMKSLMDAEQKAFKDACDMIYNQYDDTQK